MQHCLASAAELFGRRMAEADAPPPPPTALQLAVEDSARQLVAQLGGELQQRVLAQVEDPLLRVAGALQGAKWQISHLKAVGEKLREMKRRLAAESVLVERQLQPDPRQKGRSHRPPASELFANFVQFCRIRLFELSAAVAGQVCQALQSHATAASDAVQETGRELKHLAEQYLAAAQHADSKSAPSADALAPLRACVIESLRCAEEELAAEVDAQVTATVFASSGGLRTILTGGAEVRAQMLARVTALARELVLRRLQKIDLAAMLLDESADSPARPSLLRQCLEAIQPPLQVCGGSRRLLCILPQQAVNADPQALARRLGSDVFQQLPTIVHDDSSDVVLLFEMGGISLHQAASALIDHRGDLADVASRVHTRCDIPWQPLLLRSE
jgi:hypothetical protein